MTVRLLANETFRMRPRSRGTEPYRPSQYPSRLL
jgi:hypothetical protein